MKTPIYTGLFQSDLDANGYRISGLLTPSADTDAATKAYVDAHGGGGGGGGSGLDANTVIATDIGMVGDGVTDNTTALQTWLNSVGTAKVNSTLLVPDGVYIFSGALQDGSLRNAQILFPSTAVTDPTYSITIKGYHPLSYIPWPDLSMPSPKGPIFRSTLATGTNTRPSFIGGMGPAGGDGAGGGADLSFMCVRFENMVFQTIQNPQISCLNLSHFSVVELGGDVIVMAGTKVGESDTVQPTTTTSYGLILPPNNYGMIQRVENINVSNFYTGVLMGELTQIISMACELCVYALEFGAAYHITLIGRIVDWHCKNGVHMTGACPFQVQQYDIERAPAARWCTRVYDIDDASNFATAEITWRTVVAFVGGTSDFTINGGANVQARQVGTLQASPFYIGTDARLTAISGGVKLEVRNTGTGVWVEATRYTNP